MGFTKMADQSDDPAKTPVPPPDDKGGVNNVPDIQAGPSTILETVVPFFRRNSGKIWTIMAPFLGFLVAYLVIEPGKSRPTEIEQDVPTAWNNSIQALGFEPLYPPSEDFNVGDLLITISGDGLDDATLANPLVRKLLYRSIRVGNLKLANEAEGRLHFTDTATCSGGGETTDQKQNCSKLNITSSGKTGLTNSETPVDIAVVGFPGVSISTLDYGSLDLAALGSTNIGMESAKVRVISIPEASTYGAAVPEALGKLLAYCYALNPSPYCSDRVSRNILSAVYGGLVNLEHLGVKGAKESRRYALPIELKLITRVYLTSEIEAKTVFFNARKFDYEKLGKDSVKPVGSTSAAPEAVPEIKSQDVNGVGAINDDSLNLNYRYSKPLVIGFKAVSILLDNSIFEDGTPKDKEKPQ